MKRFFAFLTAAVMLFSVAACGGNTGTEQTAAAAPPSSTSAEEPPVTTTAFVTDLPPTTSPDEPPVTTTADTAEPFEEKDLSALAMVGYVVDDEGRIYFDSDLWSYSEDYDLFREYFFGTWENVEEYPWTWIIDDSEQSNLWFFGGFYKVDENVLAFTMSGNAEKRLFWLDKNDPERMYEEASEGGGQLYQFQRKDHKTAVFTKTDAPPNEPENNYLSRIRLRELSRDYGIDIHEMIYIDCITDREVDGEKTTVHLDAGYYPKYLISEAPDRLELKTSVGNGFLDVVFDARVTFEKVGGEWVRTVEFDGDVRLA